MMRVFLCAALALRAIFASANAPAATKVVTLHSFGNGMDGQNPGASPISVKGTLYGTTVYGGTYYNGTVYVLDSKTRTETLLHCLILLAMTPDQFRAAFAALDWSQTRLAGVLGISDRVIRRWASGQTPIPQCPRPSSAGRAL